MFKGIEGFLLSRREGQISQLGASYYYYKGLRIHGFPSYFAGGGIRPSRSDSTSLTHSWLEAEDYGNIHEFGAESGCFAVFKRSGIQGELRESLSETGYKGAYFIPWESLERLFIADTMLTEIRKVYDNVQGPKVLWEDFTSRITVFKPTKLNFRREFAHFLKTEDREWRRTYRI